MDTTIQKTVTSNISSDMKKQHSEYFPLTDEDFDVHGNMKNKDFTGLIYVYDNYITDEKTKLIELFNGKLKDHLYFLERKEAFDMNLNISGATFYKKGMRSVSSRCDTSSLLRYYENASYNNLICPKLTDNLFNHIGDTVNIKINKLTPKEKIIVKPLKSHSFAGVVCNNACWVRMQFNHLSIDLANIGGNLWALTKNAFPLDFAQFVQLQISSDGNLKELIYVPRNQVLSETDVIDEELLFPRVDGATNLLRYSNGYIGQSIL